MLCSSADLRRGAKRNEPFRLQADADETDRGDDRERPAALRQNFVLPAVFAGSGGGETPGRQARSHQF